MPLRHQYESEYKAKFKPYKVWLNKEPQFSPQPGKGQNGAREQEVCSHKEETAGRRSKLKNKHENTRKQGKENRALQYKAGLAPAMPHYKKQNFVSEYQKQFDWKKPLSREAPIMSAERMIFQSQDNLPPAKMDKIGMPSKSEYQLQFVNYPLVTPPRDKGGEAEKEEGAVKRVKHHHDGWQGPSASQDKSPPPPAPSVPHKAMTLESEYHANFQPPSKYEYVKGAWVGADPPHLYAPEKDLEEERQPSPSWYQQVTELRNKVLSYRARARDGSQFMGILKELQERQSDMLERANRKTRSGADTKKLNEGSDANYGKRNQVHMDMKLPAQQEMDPRITKPVQHVKISDKQSAKKPTDSNTSAGQKLNKDEKSLHPVKRPNLTITRPHSIDSLSHVSTKGSSEDQEQNNEGPQYVSNRREAWPKPGPVYPRVVPPYGVSSNTPSSIGSDSVSDVTLLDEISCDRRRVSTPDSSTHPRIDDKTRKLFTGRNQGERGGEQRLELSSEEYSYSSGDEMSSCSSYSRASDALSVEAMEKRRALASKTLQRARNRKAQF